MLVQLRLPTVLVTAHYLVAGLALQLTVTQLLSWWRRRQDRAALWFGLSAAGLTAGLVANAWVIKAPADQIEAALLVRSVFLMAVLVLQVPAVAAFVGAVTPWRGVMVLGLLAVVRLSLWTWTDQVFTHAVGSDGVPVYGPLVAVVSLPLLALLIVIIVGIARHWHDRVERFAYAAGMSVATVVLITSIVTSNGPLAEVLTGIWILPSVAALQVIASRRTAKAELAERALAAQEAAVSEELARSERRSILALRAGGMGWYEWDPATRALAASPEFGDLLGIPRGCIPATVDALLEYVHADDRLAIGAAIDATPVSGQEAEVFRVVRPDGVTHWIEANGRTVLGPEGRVEVLGVVRDITERKVAERELTYLASHDQLTGLANRSALTTCMRGRLAQDRSFALLIMDLNGFKDVNDMLGHPVGDEVLVAMARRVGSVLRSADLLARIGGDEFALVVADGAEAAERTGRQVLAALDVPVEVDGVAISLRASVGIVQAPQDGTDADTLLRRADTAMYRAKALGGGIHRYAADDDRCATRRLQLAGQLPGALASGQIELHYQPTIDIASGRCSVVEALARWFHPEHGLVSPAEFVPLAEHYGLGPALARHAMSDALATCAEWRSLGLADTVAVNVSPRTLLHPGFVGHVATALTRARLPGDALALELTEDSFAEDTEELAATLARLRDLGIRLAIDDFGTGYSSLAYLERIPATTVKLDRVFAAGLSSDGANDAIVAMSIELAHRLGFAVVAEGVETPEALAALAHYGCDAAQGYLICRPAPKDVIQEWLRATRP